MHARAATGPTTVRKFCKRDSCLDFQAQRAVASQMKRGRDGDEFYLVTSKQPEARLLVHQAEDLRDEILQLPFKGGIGPDTTEWRSDV